MVKAVVLAAGVGSRLRPRTRELPKALLSIGPDGQTVLGRLLAQCAASAVEEVIVVTGHGAAAVDRYVEAAPLPVRTLFNPDFATMNNGQSLLVARPLLEGTTFLKFDGDLVLHANLLPRLLAAAPRSCILFDDTRPLDEEDMKAQVSIASGLVTAFGKHLPPNASGISIGAERIHADDTSVVFDALERMIHAQGRTEEYYEDAYDDALGRGFEIGFAPTAECDWTEIDTQSDLEAARAAVGRSGARSVQG